MDTQTSAANERREGWGMSVEAVCRVLYPQSTDEVRAAWRLAADEGLTVHTWGNGRSYGDAALNESNLLLDFSRMNQVLEWDAESGVVVVQPGITLGELWRHCLPDGYWPPVVSGTMTTTVGGCLAANVHGKNNLRHGTIGEHVLSFELVTPEGEVLEVDRDSHPDVFHAAIGGFGWLGTFTRVTLQMKRVYSGRLEVSAWTCENLDAMFDDFERAREQGWDYVVGWIDGFARGRKLGRGQIHAARYLEPGEDPEGEATLALEHQDLPSTFFGVIPKSWLWRLMKPFANRWGMRLVNWARFFWMDRPSNQHTELQTHAQFNFLLDYVPHWKWIYKPGGLIQYQFFLPESRARDVFQRAMELMHDARLESWLVVMKRHRPDPFWLSHAVDGYSFACDFPVTEDNRGDLFELTRAFNRMVVEAGGRFYFAKDSVVDPQSVRSSFGDRILRRFFALKRALDPRGLASSNLFRRVMQPIREALGDVEGALDEPLPATLEMLAEERDPARPRRPITEELERPVMPRPQGGQPTDEAGESGDAVGGPDKESA